MDFKQTQQTYIHLKSQFEQGRITAKEFEASVNEMVVTDSAGILWQIGVKTGKWYRYDGQNWVEDIPREFKRSSTEASAQIAYVPPPPPVENESESTYQDQTQPGKNTWLRGVLVVGVLGLCCLVFSGGGWLAWSNNIITISGLPVVSPLIPPSVAPLIPSVTAVVPSTTSPEPIAGPGFDPDLVQFQDDFSNPSSGWQDIRVRDDFNTYYFEDAYLFVILKATTSAEANPYKDFPGDVQVEVDARKISGSQFDEYGLLCHYIKNSDGTHNYYYFAIAIDGLGVIYKIDHDKKSLIITDPPKNRSDVIHPGDQANRIRADCVGDTLTLYANGQSLINAVDSSFTGGDVGLRVDSETGETEIRFDNFIVFKPDN